MWKILKVLQLTRSVGHLPLVLIWVMAILVTTYMIASGSVVDHEVTQIVQEVRDILGFDF